MNKRRGRQWTCLAAVLAAGVLLLLNAGAAAAQSPEPRVLKVAFPQLEGLSKTDEYGIRTGLFLDYLNEIAKYTGWEYEFIESNNDDVVNNFIDGQYDLMGGTFYSPGFEEYFAYPDYSTGRSRAVLLCRRDDDSLLNYDLTTLNGKTIGVYERAADKIKYLQEFLSSYDLDCSLRYYSYEDMEDTGNLYGKLRDGEVDMLLGNDLEIGGEFRMVTSFLAQPYYIVTTVGNTEVLEGLNMALQYILESTPNFADEAYFANFPDLKLADIQLNDKELRYIKEKKSVTVAVPENWHPFYCENSAVEYHKGMLPDLFKEISAFTGLQFTYVHGDNYAECIRLVQEGKADILGAYLDGDEAAFADKLAQTQPYIAMSNIVLKHKSVSYPSSGLSCGILTGRTLPASFEASEVHSFDTVPELLEAVNTGKVDYIFGVSAILEQEMQKHRYLNVAPVSRDFDNTEAAFAVARPVKPELLTVLNKAIGNIPTNVKSAILNRNLVSAGYTSLSVKEFIYANPFVSLLVMAGVLFLIMAVILLIIRNRMRSAMMESRLEAAEAKSQAKSGFLSQMSHEIRTPMNAIVGLTDLTRMEQNVPPEIEAKLKKIHGSSQYLLALINDILDMSRIENGKMEVEHVNFSLSAMLGELKEMMSVQAEQKGLRFTADVKCSHDWLIGDPIRLRQILANLLSNAIKFTPEGGSVTLLAEEITGSEDMAVFHFSVKDTGIGIPPGDQERIFYSFEQPRPSASQCTGTGLGLPISRNLARLMGGDLSINSEPGKGTEAYMTLRLPLGREEVRKEQEDAGERQSLNGMKILLAEDNDLNAEIAEDLLAAQGVKVCRAANGQEAVDIFMTSAPWEFDAVLMDIRMPLKDGHEAARDIRNCGRPDADIPIIAMTANSFKEDEEKARAAGMNGFIPKPVDSAKLFEILRKSV